MFEQIKPKQIKVLFFASLREEVGVAELKLAACDSEHLWSVLAEHLSSPGMAALRDDAVRMAVNQTIVEGVTGFADGDEVAFLPPVTGG